MKILYQLIVILGNEKLLKNNEAVECFFIFTQIYVSNLLTPPKKTQTLHKVEISKIIYQKIKDLENIKKNRKESVQRVQYLEIRKQERDIRKKKVEEKTIK